MELEMEEAQKELAERRLAQSERRQTTHRIAEPGGARRSVRSSARSFGLWRICAVGSILLPSLKCTF